jgi:hypothetical protein
MSRHFGQAGKTRRDAGVRHVSCGAHGHVGSAYLDGERSTGDVWCHVELQGVPMAGELDLLTYDVNVAGELDDEVVLAQACDQSVGGIADRWIEGHGIRPTAKRRLLDQHQRSTERDCDISHSVPTVVAA